MSPTAEQEIRNTTSAASEAVFSPIQSEYNLRQIWFKFFFVFRESIACFVLDLFPFDLLSFFSSMNC